MLTQRKNAHKKLNLDLREMFLCVCISVCTVVAHSIAQASSDNVHSLPLSQHCYDVVCWRERKDMNWQKCCV